MGSFIVAYGCTGLVAPRHVEFLVPLPGIEPEFHVLQVRFLTTGPPGKSCFFFKL